MTLKINLKYAQSFIDKSKYEARLADAKKALESINNKTCKGNEFLGWLNLPSEMKSQLADIKETAKKIQNDVDILLVIGIGGSYLGARAVIGALTSKFKDFEKDGCQVMFAGHHMSDKFTNDLYEYLKDKKFAINIISKSGTTTEPAIAFRIFKKLLEKQHGAEKANNFIYATTDGEKGTLKELANENGWKSYVIPDNVGGRFSVYTAVGLLPIAVSGVDIDKLIHGAADAEKELQGSNTSALEYAAIRNTLYDSGFKVENLANYNSFMYFTNEWWKQLFGESEGKDQKGILPTATVFSTDLHSLGQYIQEGLRFLIETTIVFKESTSEFNMFTNENDGDGLNFLSEKTLHEINNTAQEAVVIAHNEGGVPVIKIEIDKLDEYNLGYLLYFFELSCAISGIVLGVNPFDQPGVEEYKKNMFALLGKPGFEDLRKELEEKLSK